MMILNSWVGGGMNYGALLSILFRWEKIYFSQKKKKHFNSITKKVMLQQQNINDTVSSNFMINI